MVNSSCHEHHWGFSKVSTIELYDDAHYRDVQYVPSDHEVSTIGGFTVYRQKAIDIYENHKDQFRWNEYDYTRNPNHGRTKLLILYFSVE